MGGGRQVLHGTGQPHGDGEAGKCRGFGTGGSWAGSPISAAVLCSTVHRVLSAGVTRASLSVCALRGSVCRFPRAPQKLGCPQGFLFAPGAGV